MVRQSGKSGAEGQSKGLGGRSVRSGWWQPGGLVFAFLQASGPGISGYKGSRRGNVMLFTVLTVLLLSGD